jgi:hypothetical protein
MDWIRTNFPSFSNFKCCIDLLQPYFPRGRAQQPFIHALPTHLSQSGRLPHSSKADFDFLEVSSFLCNYLPKINHP